MGKRSRLPFKEHKVLCLGSDELSGHFFLQIGVVFTGRCRYNNRKYALPWVQAGCKIT